MHTRPILRAPAVDSLGLTYGSSCCLLPRLASRSNGKTATCKCRHVEASVLHRITDTMTARGVRERRPRRGRARGRGHAATGDSRVPRGQVPAPVVPSRHVIVHLWVSLEVYIYLCSHFIILLGNGSKSDI